MKVPRDDVPWAADDGEAGADPERLAALLDGRLDGAEREALLARLAADDDDLALFAEAAAIQRALEEEDAAVLAAASAPPHVLPVLSSAPSAGAVDGDATDRDAADGDAAEEPGVIPLRRPSRRVDRRLMALAAVLAGVTLLPLAWRASRPGAVSSPSQAVAMLESRDAGLPPGADRPAWPVTRGGGDAATERSTSARVGAHVVSLELAIRAGDVEQRQVLVGNVQATLQNTTALAERSFEPLADGTRTDRDQLLSDLSSATETATSFLEADYVALGGWAQAARFAAERRDAAFFRSPRTARTLAKAEPLVADNEGARSALARVSAARTANPLDWPALTQAVGDLLYAIAS